MNPKISVVTVTYNAEEYIKKTINSVLSQKYNNIEYIIVDGLSKDNTVNIVQKYLKKIDIFKSEKDTGIYDAMNKGMNLASGEFITFLNAGDTYCNDNVIGDMFNESSKEAYDVVYGDHIALLNNKKYYRKAKKFSIKSLNIFVTSVVCHQAIFVKTSLSPKYDTSLVLKGELDWYFNILTTKTLKIKYIDIPVVYYERGGVGEQKYILNLKEILYVLYKHGGVLALISASAFYIKYLLKIFNILIGRYKFEN